MDFIRELGVLALGSRLARLLERMNRDISEFYRVIGADFEARWFTIIYLLGRQSPMRITDIAGRLGVSHQAVKKQARHLTGAGLIRSFQGREDRRERLYCITDKGEETIADLTDVWGKIGEVVTRLTAAPSKSLLESVEAVEKRLDRKSLLRRLQESMRTDGLASDPR